MNNRLGSRRRHREARKANGEEHEASGENGSPEQPMVWWKYSEFWTAAGTIVIAGFTVVLAVVGYFQYGILQTTDETQRISDSAYVFPQKIDIESSEERDAKTNQRLWNIVPVWENSGNTPTRHLSVYTGYYLGTAKTVPAPNFSDIVPEDVVLGPRQAKRGTTAKIKASDMALVAEEKTQLMVFGLVTYTDAFDRPRVTMFCRNVYANPIDFEEPGAATKSENLGLDCMGFNCADKDCRKYKGQKWLPENAVP